MVRWLRLVLVTLPLVLLGCSAPEPSREGPSSPSSSTARATSPVNAQSYVALGDSYTSAPYVPPTDIAQGCLRSQRNYPRLLAADLGLRLRDVSCGGARTENLRQAQPTYGTGSNAPQLRALSGETDLVTLGIGANDDDFFVRLVRTCPVTGPDGGRITGTGRCGYLEPTSAQRMLATIGANLDRALSEVKRAAPRARVLLIGYPDLVGAGACAALPIDRADLPAAQALTRELRDTMRAAARRSGVEFIDVWAASRGHEICSASPWVQGVRTDTSQAAALHPRLSGQQGVARAIATRLEKADAPRR